MTLSDFFFMGGYAAYIWPSYGLALLILTYNFYHARRQERDLINRIFEQGEADAS